MCVFLMNLMSERMSSGSAVRTTCNIRQEPEPYRKGFVPTRRTT